MSLVSDDSVTSAVRRLLRQNHVKQRDLASSIGMHEQVLSNKMHGLRPFTLRDLSRIADYFDVSLDYLTGRSDYTKPLEVA
ncbi:MULTISPECIES: helix-turn-helix domain-containing protein [Bifidobacterium]|nr:MULTISPECIES: helix-turn-helix transcriptional regulator [Bifidobacterium]MCB4870160.1 helix-turn-helix domain-containing protein [Bifidobacterium pseudocatenulatum]MDR4032352.1 helix-turn-helix transcriptional regulator [Bifidobacterium sp.]RGU31651.1 XRE family transcriptional regulator [Bifidobacterium pseudocatenulatum]